MLLHITSSHSHVSASDLTFSYWHYSNISLTLTLTSGVLMNILIPLLQGHSHVSKIGVVHLSFRPPTGVKGVEGRAMVRGCPIRNGLRGLGSVARAPPWWGLGRSPSCKRFGGISCAILCDFTHLLVHITAAWKQEIPTSLYWLGVMFPFNFFRVSDTLTWIFWGVRKPKTPTATALLEIPGKVCEFHED